MGRTVDRFRLEARLGSGGGGEVYRARDDASGEVVALKLVPYERAGEEALHAEFEVASSLRHPNIVRLLEYGLSEDGKSYFTMDLVEGGVSIVDHQLALDLGTLHRLASQLCSALSYLHGRGLLHGDLKPSNVLVVGSGADARVRLLDFGLARHRRSGTEAGGGTIGYMAPETAVAGRSDVRSELYSLGAVLHHVVTQQPPVGSAPEDFDRAMSGGGLPPVASRAPDLDPDWARLIDGLVAREPGARPVSAVEVQEILDAWADAHGAERLGPPVRDRDRPAPAIGGSLVGRTVELELAAERIAAARAGGGGTLLFLHGESGIGKTRLVEEIRGRAQLARARVVTACCAAGDSRPFALASAIVRALEPGLSSVIVSRHAEAIGVLCGTDAPQGAAAPGDVRLRIVGDAAAIVTEAATAAPLVVVLDDVHAADADAVAFLRALAVRLAATPLVLLCAGRDEELPGGLGGDLEGEPFVRTVRLERLPEAIVRELVDAALGEVEAERSGAPPDLAAAVHRASGGNPLLAEEALRGWIDAGILWRARGTWVLRPDLMRLASAPSPSVQEAIAARLDRLERVPRRVLVAASALGEAIDSALLAEVANMPVDRLEVALGTLVAQRLLRAEGARQYRFAQGIVREVVYDRTPAAGRERIHARALEILSRRRDAGEPIPLDELARHALRAGDVERGRTLCLEAAREAERACAVERAIEWTRGLLTLGVAGEEALAAHEKIGDLALVAGRADLARASYEAALGLGALGDRARLARKRAEAQLLGGDPRRALQEIDEALAAAPADDGLPPSDRLELAILRVQALYRVGALDDALGACAAAEVLAVRAKREDRAAFVENLRGATLSLAGRADAAITALKRAARFGAQSGDHAQLASARNDLAIAYNAQGRYQRAAASARGAARIWRRLGMVTRVPRAQNNLGLAALQLGRWNVAEESFRDYGLASEMLGNRWGRVATLANQSMLAQLRGDVGRGLSLAERALALAIRWGLRWPQVTAQMQVASSRLQAGDHEQARRDLAQARALADAIDAAGLLLSIDVVQVEALLESGEVAEARKLGEAALARAFEGCAVEDRQTLQLLLARIARTEGRLDAARALLDLVLGSLTAAQAPFAFARAQLELGQVLAELGETERAIDLARAARRTFLDLGARREIDRTERFLEEIVGRPDSLRRAVANLQALLEASQSLAGVLDVELVLERVVDHVLEITKGERALLALTDAEGRIDVRLARTAARETIDRSSVQPSLGLVEEVMRTGRSVSVTDVSDDVRFRTRRSVRELGLRSMACVPLRAAGRVLGVLYVDSSRAGARTFRADLPTIEALATQAATAIDTARLYASVREKNELLGMLAHELRTPLTAIMGFAQLLADVERVPGEKRSTYLRALLQHSERMARLIDEVVELSRVGSDRTPWIVREVQSSAVIDETLRGLEPIAAGRGVRLETHLEEALPSFRGDPDRIVQVLSNLVVNAVTYSDPGKAVIVSGHSVRLPGDRLAVEIRVRDEGPGIPASEVPTIFEPFVRGRGATGHAGAGLGLHICHTIVHRHGGRIWVESTRGQGSTFVFQIPAAS